MTRGTFEWAFASLKGGAFIRRSSWVKIEFVSLSTRRDRAPTLRFHPGDVDSVDGDFWGPENDDLFASDWEVIKT